MTWVASRSLSNSCNIIETVPVPVMSAHCTGRMQGRKRASSTHKWAHYIVRAVQYDCISSACLLAGHLCCQPSRQHAIMTPFSPSGLVTLLHIHTGMAQPFFDRWQRAFGNHCCSSFAAHMCTLLFMPAPTSHFRGSHAVGRHKTLYTVCLCVSL